MQCLRVEDQVLTHDLDIECEQPILRAFIAQSIGEHLRPNRSNQSHRRPQTCLRSGCCEGVVLSEGCLKTDSGVELQRPGAQQFRAIEG